MSHSSRTVLRYGSWADLLFMFSCAYLSFWHEHYLLCVLLLLLFPCCFIPHSLVLGQTRRWLICNFFPFHFALVNQDMFTLSNIKNLHCVCFSQATGLAMGEQSKLHLPIWKTDQWLINSVILVQLTSWIWLCWVVFFISSPTLNLSITLLLKVLFPSSSSQITFWCSSGVHNVKGLYCHLLLCWDSLNTFLLQHI